MKTFPLLLVAACLCAAFVDASRHDHRARNAHESRKETDDSQGPSWFKDLLQPGNEYCFEYNAQISSGYAHRVSPQQAMSRLRSKVCLGVNEQNVGTLRMEQVQTGQRNEAYGSGYEGESPSYFVMQPMQSFNKAQQQEQETIQQKLTLPVQFSYNDGLVSNIQFHQDDEPWSKNLKKAVLNLIQLNASPNMGNPQEQDEAESAQNEDGQQRQGQQGQSQRSTKQNRAFTIMEANVEGICQTSYTVTPLKSEDDPRKNTINVTKSIDFERCEALADVAYGYQVEPRPARVFSDQPVLSGLQGQSQPSHTGTAIPKEKLSRSTTVRVVLSKNAQRPKTQNGNAYGIKRVELVSEYIMKSSQAESTQAMQTVAIAELQFGQCRQSAQEPANIDASQSRAESLLYNSYVESAEKEFFMKGDQSDVDVFRFSKKDGQAVIQKGVRQLKNLVKIFVEENKKHGGIDSEQSIESLEELVKAMRICSMDELRQIESQAQDKITQASGSDADVTKDQKKQIAADLFADALAIAATRNTIALLAEKIKNFEQQDQQNGKSISEMKAVQLLNVLGRGAGLPAPSDAQVDSIVELCKSDKVQKSENGLKQSCWLTFGTMVGELTLQSHKAKSLGATKTPMKESEICPEAKLDLYKDILIEQLNAAQTVYEKILALKCIGNAGLIPTIPALREVFTDKTESPVVRINAIDALRRLKFQLPTEAIHSQILPLYADTEDDSEVRMKAFGMIMRTRPSKAVIDQIAMVMANEKSTEVQGLVYSHIKAMSESPLPQDTKCADHLKNAMKLAQVDEEEMQHQHALGASQRRRYAAYNEEQQEGVFVDWTQIFPETSELPSHINFGLDTFFNGQFNQNSAKLSICQNDIEKIVKKVFGNSQYDLDDDEDEQEQQQDKQEDEPGFFSKAVDKLKGIFGKANIKGRQQNQKAKKTGAYVMATLRLNNVDLAIAPLLGNGKDSAGTASQIARKAKQALASMLQRFGADSEKVRMQLNAAVVINSRMSSVPTSVGSGLRMRQSMYLVGQVKASAKIYSGGKADVKLHPNLNWIQTQKMEAKICRYSTGVQSTRSVEVNLPLDVQVQQITNRPNGKQEYKLTFKVPEKKATIFGAHSLPFTFAKAGNATLQSNSNINQKEDEPRNEQSWSSMKTIYNQLLINQERHVNFTAGDNGFLGVPVRVGGHFQQPRRWDSLQEIMDVIMSGENSIHVEFHPQDTNRREIQVTFGWNLFQTTPSAPATSILQRIQNFYSNIAQNGLNPAKGQQQQYTDDSDESLESEQQRVKNSATKKQRQLSQSLEKQEKKRNNKHSFTVKVETIGSGRQNDASAELQVICDDNMRACDSNLNARRSPLAHERNEWSLQAQCQTLYPEYVTDFSELIDATEGENQRQQKFFTHIKVEWGIQNQAQQSIKLNAEGEASQEMMSDILDRVRQQYNQYEDDSYNQRSTRPQGKKCNSGRGCWNRKPLLTSSPRNVPFLNKYAMVAEYSLWPETEFFFQEGLEMVKNRNFWNTESRVLNSQHIQGQSERRVASSASVRSGSEQISQGQVSAILSIDHITQQHVNVTILTPSHQVKFRNMELPTKVRPMKLVRPQSQQSSLISAVGKTAKAQCKVSSKTVDTFDGVALKAPSSTCYTILAKDCSHENKPKFAVLMKSLESGSDEQKLRVITRKMLAEIEPQGEDKLRLSVNDRTFTIENGRVSQGDEETLRGFGIEAETDQKHNGQAVIVDLGQLSVKFNGFRATIQLSDEYKNVQCGLCGNFNDDTEDELRKGDNELAHDVKSFHKSYTIQDEECAPQEHQQFYGSSNGNKFGDDSDKQQTEVEPEAQTMIKETSHKVCFSQMPVKQCPEGWYPASEEETDDQPQRKSVSFSCFDRHSLEAKRLKREVRRFGTASTGDYKPNFADDVVIPTRCVAY